MKYSDKQVVGLTSLNDKNKVYYFHYGSSRSGKTWLDTRYFILRALKYSNIRQLFCRASKASCIASIWMQTLLPMLESDFKGMYQEDKTKHIINFVNGSSIWAGGFDNAQHRDELLAKEWAGILIEEATELGYGNFQKLLTRLNWNPHESNVSLKMILECNPTTPTHWLHKYFFKHIDYETGESLNEKEINQLEVLHFSVEDNKQNISEIYLDKLRNTKGMTRKRFYEGIFADSFEGQIYEFNRDINLVNDPIEYDENIETWRTWDFGISPSDTFIVWLQVLNVPESEQFPSGIRINIFDEYCNNNKDVNHYADIVNEKEYNNKNIRDAGDPAGHSRNESLQSWISKLRDKEIFVETPKGKPSIDDFISNANQYMPYIRINEKQCPRLVEAFENWSKPKDKDGKVVEGSKPEHNVYSHPGTAFYYWTGVRFPFKVGKIYLP
ncbi:MAG: hypothetical protein GWP19_11065 [Planctomycetia bacterium]|nr:hypothetical protein [Planctomycetia bacterium]